MMAMRSPGGEAERARARRRAASTSAGVLGPRVGLPDAEVLLAHGDARRPAARRCAARAARAGSSLGLRFSPHRAPARRRGRPGSRLGSSRTTPGGPSATFCPWSSTTTRSQMSIVTPMSWLTKSSVTPISSLMSRMKRAMSSFSSTFMPGRRLVEEEQPRLEGERPARARPASAGRRAGRRPGCGGCSSISRKSMICSTTSRWRTSSRWARPQ